MGPVERSCKISNRFPRMLARRSHLAPTLPTSLQSNWHLTVSTKSKYAISVHVSAYHIEPVLLVLSASPVNKLLRRIGISISSYAIAADQVQSFAVQVS
jgi:hypothetical protein